MRGFKAVAAFIAGGLAGIAAGFALYMIVRETVLPYSLWSSDLAMWAIVIAVAGALAVLSARSAWQSSPGGNAILGGVIGFFVGAILGAVLTGVVFMVAADVFNISQMEGAYAMGVVFFWVPLGAAVGGLICACIGVRLARRRQSA